MKRPLEMEQAFFFGRERKYTGASTMVVLNLNRFFSYIENINHQIEDVLYPCMHN